MDACEPISLSNIIVEKVIHSIIEVKKPLLKRICDCKFRHHRMAFFLSHVVPLLHYATTIAKVKRIKKRI